MAPQGWLPIRYRDFYDVPRMVIVERGDELFLLHSAFGEDRDDYSDTFTVYRLPSTVRELLDDEPWTDLPAIGELVGQIPVNDVEFDGTKRAAVDATIFRTLDLA